MDKDTEKEEAKRVVEMLLLGHPCGVSLSDIASDIDATYLFKKHTLEKRLRLYKLIYEMIFEERVFINDALIGNVRYLYANLNPIRRHELLDSLRRYVGLPEGESMTLDEKDVEEFRNYHFNNPRRRSCLEDFHKQIIELEERVKKDKEEASDEIHMGKG